jgi:Arc/MetJ-type ribon-helix-helix transcriptional regulator
VKTVTLRLTDSEHQACVELVCFGRFLSVSAVLREGLGMVMAAWKAKPSTIQAIQAERNEHEPRQRRASRLPMESNFCKAKPPKSRSGKQSGSTQVGRASKSPDC